VAQVHVFRITERYSPVNLYGHTSLRSILRTVQIFSVGSEGTKLQYNLPPILHGIIITLKTTESMSLNYANAYVRTETAHLLKIYLHFLVALTFNLYPANVENMVRF